MIALNYLVNLTTIPIPGFRTVAQVEVDSSALEFGPLLDKQMMEIEWILGRIDD